jgi:hypothetical protein
MMKKGENMMTLSDYIAEQNKKTQAWIDEDPKNRWAGLLSEDMFHWAEQGITTVEHFKRYELETYIWDCYKDVHGIRPRWINFSEMSTAEMEKMADDLAKEAKESIEREEQEQALAKEKFDSHILGLITEYNVDEKTAVRWDMQAENVNVSDAQDVEHYFWKKGLSFKDINFYTAKYNI